MLGYDTDTDRQTMSGRERERARERERQTDRQTNRKDDHTPVHRLNC